jgi:tetratricopeptide (TPR) repeat protein
MPPPALKQLVEAAQRAHKAGRLQEAARGYEQVLGLDSGNVVALSNLGLVLGETRHYDQAEKFLRRALSLAPGYADAYANLGAVLHDQNRFDEAIACCEQGLKLAPENRKMLNTLASSLSGAGRYDEAIALLLRMTSARPGFAKGHHFLGAMYARLGRCDEAVAAFDKAVEIDPGEVASVVAAAECLLVHGRAEPALERLEKVLKLNAYDVRALALKTLALAELGRKDDERWLSDPGRLLQTDRLADFGYGADEVAALNRSLSEFASNEPSLREDPPEYATRKAWHSTMNLAEQRNDALEVLKQFVRQVFERRVAGLSAEDAVHPFVRGAPPKYHLDLWAVKMRGGGGKLFPHIHVDGWLSGVYYVDVPRIVDDPNAGRAGWLNIGTSRSDIKLTREPLTRLVKPEPGLMVTFPSYFWHDTVPLPEDNTEQRLCLAFDLHPRKG